MRKFQPAQKIRRLFNRSKKRGYVKNNNESLLSSKSNVSNEMQIDTIREIHHEDPNPRKLKRSTPSRRHLNADGSSFDQLRQLCQRLPEEREVNLSLFQPPPPPPPAPRKEQKGHSSIHKAQAVTKQKLDCDDTMQFTLKSEGSSGRKLQVILEKLIDDESHVRKPGIAQGDNFMHEKKLNSSHDTKLNNDVVQSSNVKLPEQNNNQNDEEPVVDLQPKLRFEMSDPNVQAKRYLNTRRKKPHHGRRSNSNRKEKEKHREDLIRNLSHLVPALEVKSNSMTSMSSCSIDSALEEKNDDDSLTTITHSDSSEETNSKYFENLSYHAVKLSEDLKTKLVDTFGHTSSSCLACVITQVDD